MNTSPNTEESWEEKFRDRCYEDNGIVVTQRLNHGTFAPTRYGQDAIDEIVEFIHGLLSSHHSLLRENSLEELIKKCGDNLHTLYHEGGTHVVRWHAKNQYLDERGLAGHGETATEAVKELFALLPHTKEDKII